MLDAAWAAQDRIAKGEIGKPLPANPTPEQLTEYRKAHGIPEKSEGYWEGLKDLKIEEGDKEIISPYLPIMHELNLTPAQASKLITFRQAEADRMVDERVTADNTLRSSTEEALRGEWGGQYKANVETMRSFLQSRFGDGFDDFMNARTPNGDPLLGHPNVLRALMQLALDTNGGAPTIVTHDGRALEGASADARMKEIEGLMRDPASKYWKGSESAAIQKEYRQLIEHKERHAARGGVAK